MNDFNELVSTVKYLQSIKDTQGYRDAWALDSHAWAFDLNIEERIESAVAEYAIANDLSVKKVASLVNRAI